MAISFTVRHRVGTDTTRPTSPRPVSRHPDAADHLTAIDDRAPQTDRHTPPTMDQQPLRGQRLPEPPGQPTLISQPPQQHQPRTRHQALTIGTDIQPPRPTGDLHPQSALRTGIHKDSALSSPQLRDTFHTQRIDQPHTRTKSQG